MHLIYLKCILLYILKSETEVFTPFYWDSPNCAEAHPVWTDGLFLCKRFTAMGGIIRDVEFYEAQIVAHYGNT